MHLFNIIIIIFNCSFIKCASGMVEFVEPTVEQTFDLASSQSIQYRMKWIPSVDAISKYIFTLCTGSASSIVSVKKLGTFSQSDFPSNEAIFTIQNDMGSNGYYFIQMMTFDDEQRFAIHYTPFFQLLGMVNNNNIANKDPLVQRPAMEIGAIQSPIDNNIPYHKQVGQIKYAPMQTQPLTKVIKVHNQWQRKNPKTSQHTYYSRLYKPSISEVTTTITPGRDYYTETKQHNASPQPMPKANGGWYSKKPGWKRKPRKLNFLRKRLLL